MRETNEIFRCLVDRSPDGIVVVEQGRLRLVNAAAAQLFRAATTDELVGALLADLFHPDSHVDLDAHLTQWLDDDPARPFDARIVRADGSALPVEVAGARVDPQADAIQLTLRDSTARKQAELALRDSEERLALAVAGALEGVWDWNLETNAVVYSRRWKEMLGYADDEIEPHVSAWERLVHPDDRPRADRAAESLASQPTYEAEFRLRHKDGHYVHVLSRGFPVRREPGGSVVRIVGTHFDLSERKRAEAALRESEERLTLAFAGAQEGVWDWNLETDAVVYSTRWKEMLGYSDDEIEPHVSAWERLLHPDDRPRAEDLHARVTRGAQTYEGEFRLRHKAGHYIHVLSRGFPVRREPGGPVVRIVGTHFDLTERRRAEADRSRRELLARLVFAQEDERRRIARDMHDQFGERLTALGNRIRLLKDTRGHDPEIHRHVEALETLAQLIDHDVDTLVWELRPTALDDLGLRAALDSYIRDWSTRVKIPAELHTSGLLDERLPSETETTLYRIAQEALTNVAKHSRATSVDVILERRSDQVLLIVEDDGVGFEPADDGSDAEAKGFGLLGMQERAALVGASLEIESAAGRGTTILVRMTAADGVEHV